MAWKKDSSASFSGSSGQMAVMGELLHRNCNAAVPQVDIGTDVFAFRDDREEIARIQVKTARGKPYKDGKGYAADFRIPMDQLKRYDTPTLFYALAVRLENGWGKFLIISRARLQALWNEGCGSQVRNQTKFDLKLRIAFRPGQGEQNAVGSEEAEMGPKLRATCGPFDLTDYVDAWESLPPLKPLADIEVAGGGAAVVEGFADIDSA